MCTYYSYTVFKKGFLFFFSDTFFFFFSFPSLETGLKAIDCTDTICGIIPYYEHNILFLLFFRKQHIWYELHF